MLCAISTFPNFWICEALFRKFLDMFKTQSAEMTNPELHPELSLIQISFT